MAALEGGLAAAPRRGAGTSRSWPTASGPCPRAQCVEGESLAERAECGLEKGGGSRHYVNFCGLAYDFPLQGYSFAEVSSRAPGLDLVKNFHVKQDCRTSIR